MPDPEVIAAAVGAAIEGSESPAGDSVAESAAEVAAAAAVVAQAAATNQPIDPAYLSGLIGDMIGKFDAVLSLIDGFNARFSGLESDLAVIGGKVDEILNLELEEVEEGGAAVVIETPPEAGAPVVAETIPPSSVIVEPTPRREKARRFI